MKPNVAIDRILRKNIPGSLYSKTRTRYRSTAAQALSASLGSPAQAEWVKLLKDWAHEGNTIVEVTAEVERIIADRHRTAKQNAELRQAIQHGCLQCGSPMKRNLSMTGWWQCGQYGSVGFRLDNSKPQCSYQGFIVEDGQ